MPLVVDRAAKGPALWVGGQDGCPALPTGSRDREFIHIALINNMPDMALEDTETQFFELISSASKNLLVRIKLFSLQNVPRTERGRQRLGEVYFGINDFWAERFDCVVITGAEPKHADLRKEPYWPELVNVLDWAQENTTSTILSCLAAHAGVFHNDGIPRQPLADKQFGVFDFRRVAHHALTSCAGAKLRFPHSRWNEVHGTALASCGYDVLTQSEKVGVDLFVKKKRNSLFVHFQGHPEYGALTLLKEYRRDVRKFLRGERETFPSMPYGYFPLSVIQHLNDFRTRALANMSEELIAEFPDTLFASIAGNPWRSSATRIYRNWLRYVDSRKTAVGFFPAAQSGRWRETSSKRPFPPVN